jgi:hypothetical protein
VTSKLNDVPGQYSGEGPVGVITYSTTPGIVPVLSNGSFIFAPQLELQGLNPVRVPSVGEVITEAVHANDVYDVADVTV